jgi:hypothetical protein
VMNGLPGLGGPEDHDEEDKQADDEEKSQLAARVYDRDGGPWGSPRTRRGH